ncbi:hypothetical protein DHEL01_v203807 [Diaporthe helianthi]|uniref:Uncharacterized protein n=1 Tax=Diaporthe helianthi TaxID=158607 RepID=A0A2P5I5M8_DIAHE|nr:hypothetical protein DHEL01_v203807 [Diaporthe helianthi]
MALDVTSGLLGCQGVGRDQDQRCIVFKVVEGLSVPSEPDGHASSHGYPVTLSLWLMMPAYMHTYLTLAPAPYHRSGDTSQHPASLPCQACQGPGYQVGPLNGPRVARKVSDLMW